MNYRGSSRKLLGNSQAAMLAAIEIYNKPQVEYRDECFVVLLINAWELVLKACLSKHGESIYYPKKKHEPYKTLSLRDALNRAGRYFPPEIPYLSISRNIALLEHYRDNVVHFYNEPRFGTVIYPLAQTSIVNYTDFLRAVFDVDLTDRISWRLLPIGINPPIGPIEYIGGIRDSGAKHASPEVKQFVRDLALAVKEITDLHMDTGRLLTIFDVNLQSQKKIQLADVVVGVVSAGAAIGKEAPLTVIRKQDPNETHPFRRTDVLERVSPKIGAYDLQAIEWKHNVKSNRLWCWQDTKGAVTLYSPEVVEFLKTMPADEVKAVREAYSNHRKANRKPRFNGRR